MSNRALASHLRRTVDGPMWHGPALMELLSTISVTHASARPIPSAHTIAELVVHMTAWATIARERLHSATPVEATPEQDWPTAAGLDSSGWHDALAQLRAAYEALAKEVETLDEAALRVTVRGRDHSVETMIRGVVEHGVYHGGQVALLKRALESAPSGR